MTKVCVSCRYDKPLDSFAKNKRMKDGLGYYCKDCRRNVNREVKEWIDEIKSERGCVDCENKDPRVLDFDHRLAKRFNISAKRPRSTKHKKLLLEEMAKCDIRCANCHRIRTYEEKMYG